MTRISYSVEFERMIQVRLDYFRQGHHWEWLIHHFVLTKTIYLHSIFYNLFSTLWFRYFQFKIKLRWSWRLSSTLDFEFWGNWRWTLLLKYWFWLIWLLFAVYYEIHKLLTSQIMNTVELLSSNFSLLRFSTSHLLLNF
jgi:hypothetical protein